MDRNGGAESGKGEGGGGKKHTDNVIEVPREHNSLLAQTDRRDFGDETVADWTDCEIVEEGEDAVSTCQQVCRRSRHTGLTAA